MKDIAEEEDETGGVLESLCTPVGFEGEFNEVRMIFWRHCTDSVYHSCHLLCACCCVSVFFFLRMSCWQSWRNWKRMWTKTSLRQMKQRTGTLVPKCWPLLCLPIVVRLVGRALTLFLQLAVASVNSWRLCRDFFSSPKPRWTKITQTCQERCFTSNSNCGCFRRIDECVHHYCLQGFAEKSSPRSMTRSRTLLRNRTWQKTC